MGTWRMPRPPVPLFWECVCFCSWVGAGLRSILPAISTHRYTHRRGSLDLVDLISLCLLGKNQWISEAPMGGWGCRSIAGLPLPTSSNRHRTNSSWQLDESHLGWGDECRSCWILLAIWFFQRHYSPKLLWGGHLVVLDPRQPFENTNMLLCHCCDDLLDRKIKIIHKSLWGTSSKSLFILSLDDNYCISF